MSADGSYTPSHGTNDADVNPEISVGELLAAPRAPVDHRDRRHAGERGLDRDRPRGAAGAEQHEVMPAGSTTVRSEATNPLPSVFSPIHRPSRSTTQLTAPINAADSRQLVQPLDHGRPCAGASS